MGKKNKDIYRSNLHNLFYGLAGAFILLGILSPQLAIGFGIALILLIIGIGIQFFYSNTKKKN